MRNLLIAALSFVASLSVARADEGRFFLMVASAPPAPELVKAAYREAHRAASPLPPAVGRTRLGEAFPRLFAAGRTLDPSALEGDLKTGRAAHFNGQYAEAETALLRALDAISLEPELIAGSPALLQRLVDAAATRYRNTLARRRPVAEARAQVEAFLALFPQTTPTPSDHAPEVLALWAKVRAAQKATFGSLLVGVHPLELERSGTCRILLNGAELARLPLPGPLGVPRGAHFLQVRCGAQLGWQQRLVIGESPVSVRVPVRAMIAARGDPSTGGLVLVAPSEGDVAALVQAVSRATALKGAILARSGGGRIELGRWDRARAGPIVDAVGRTDGVDIEKVHGVDATSSSNGSGGAWPWVVGGLGLATLGGAVVANVITADKITHGESDVGGLKTATVALYVAGGALVATSIVWLLLEGDPAPGASAWRPGPGGWTVRF